MSPLKKSIFLNKFATLYWNSVQVAIADSNVNQIKKIKKLANSPIREKLLQKNKVIKHFMESGVSVSVSFITNS